MKRLKYPSVLPFCNLYKLFHCSAIAVFTSHHSSLLISRVFSGGKVRQVTQVFSLIQQSSKMTNENLFDNSFALHTVRNTCSYLCTNINKQVVHFLIWVGFFYRKMVMLSWSATISKSLTTGKHCPSTVTACEQQASSPPCIVQF